MVMMRIGKVRLLSFNAAQTVSKGNLPSLINSDLPANTITTSLLCNISTNAFYPGLIYIAPTSANKCQVRYVKTLGGGVDSFNGTVYGAIAYLVP